MKWNRIGEGFFFRWGVCAAVLCLLFSAAPAVFCWQEGQENDKPVIDTLEFPAGYPGAERSALEQLKNFPSPRYADRNTLLRLFNWMDPYFMGGAGRTDVSKPEAVKNAVDLQEELALHWNYDIVIPNSKMPAYVDMTKAATNPTLSYILLANKYPEIPLGVITFWVQVKPTMAGFKYRKPIIISPDLDDGFYLHYTAGGKPRKVPGFRLPDSLIAVDGNTQRFYLSNILSRLNRPINIINENGEEPPGAELLDIMKDDPGMKRLKDSLHESSWEVFAAKQKLRMRNVYSASFMNTLPGLKNTMFSWYIVEGGPVDRFDWHIMKKCVTPVKGNYYSTPDFYPRWPYNWKDWKGPWHGWKWIEEGRKNEIADGDRLFSPFVCAGWSRNPEEDVRPGQWLGLLKCLSAAGAEFFYVGYFNEGKAPFTDPRQYAWQAAMAAYAQAITSRYEDDLRNGDLLKDAKGNVMVSVKTSDPNVLLVVRRNKVKNRYVICGTLQPFSNNKDEVPPGKIITAEFDGHRLTFEVRRRGSVYIYDLSGGTNDPVFYQLDSWHQDAHPDHWTKDMMMEAEVHDSPYALKVFTETNSRPANDFSIFTSFIKLADSSRALYNIVLRGDTVPGNIFIRCRPFREGALVVWINGKKVSEKGITLKADSHWEWVHVKIPGGCLAKGRNVMGLEFKTGKADVDKILVSYQEHPLLSGE